MTKEESRSPGYYPFSIAVRIGNVRQANILTVDMWITLVDMGTWGTLRGGDIEFSVEHVEAISLVFFDDVHAMRLARGEV